MIPATGDDRGLGGMLMNDVEQKAISFIHRERLIRFDRAVGDKSRSNILLVAVSGGPDSVCLLHLLHRISDVLGVSLHAVHLNHMLRGNSADEDEQYVKALCAGMGVPLTIERADVGSYREKRGLSIEEAARKLRYDFFVRSAVDYGTDNIALGHTRDDQVETLMMHLVRGSGVAGMRGMRPLTAWRSPDGITLNVIRPLLEITRGETQLYCRECGLQPRVDLSNFSPDHMRNRFRHELLPLMRKYNKNIDEALARAARSAALDIDFIERQVDDAWSRVVTVQPNGLLIDKALYSQYHPSLRMHLLRRAAGYIHGDLIDIHAVHVEKMDESMSKPAGKRLSLPGGMMFHIGYESCLLSRSEKVDCLFPALDGEYALSIDGETHLPGWRVRTTVLREVVLPSDGFTAYLDLDRCGTELTVRRRRPGDRFQPLGMDVQKKLQDFMVDARTPRSWRDCIPLVCSPEGIIWVVGWRIAEWAKVTDDTRSVLCVEFELV